MTLGLHWVPHVLAIELKKVFSYRVNFWAQFLMGTGTELAVAYFVWKAVFSATKEMEIEGFTFHGLVFYSLFANFSSKITRGTDKGYISQDIYDGGLTRYLLYPLPFFPYKFVVHLTQQLLGVIQLLIALAFIWLLIGDTGGQHVTVGSFFAGLVTCVFTGYLHFVMMSCLELVAFWQDVVWNLMVMLRFCMSLLGGGMLPLVFFPEWGQKLVQFTPFPALISFPTRTFLGQIGLQEWFWNLGILAGWGLVMSLLLSWIWQRGTRRYSGVGI